MADCILGRNLLNGIGTLLHSPLHYTRHYNGNVSFFQRFIYTAGMFVSFKNGLEKSPDTLAEIFYVMARTNLFYPLLLSSVLLTQPGCKKSDDSSDSTLVGNWVRSSDFDGNARSEAVTFTVGSKAYIATGTSSTQRYNDVWEYDESLKYWTQKASLPGNARNSAVAFTVNDKGYIGTGYDGVNRLNDFWEYNPATNQWTQKAAFPGSARYDATGFALAGKGYICAGFDGNYLKDLWEYNPATDAWTQRASLGGAKRSAAMSFVLNGSAYVVSGNNNGTALNDLWRYDATDDTWTQKRAISNTSSDTYDDKYSGIERYNGVGFALNGKGYLTCGENGSLTNTTWEYNDADDTWTQKTGFEGSTRTGAVAFTLNNQSFVLTGRNGSLSYDNCYEWKQNDTYNAND